MGNTTVATADYGTVLTRVGAEKLAACILNGTKLNITHAAVGDGNGAYYKPTAEQECLLNECWRGEIASYEINETNANMLDVKFIVPAEVGGFTVREAAIFDAEGDMIAVCNTPAAQKVAVTDGVSFPLPVIMHIIVTDASVVEVTVNSTLDTVSREELEAALQTFGASVGTCLIMEDFVIPAEGWYEHGLTDPDYADTPWAVDVPEERCTAEYFPLLALHRSSQKAAEEAGLSSQPDTLAGAVRIFAETVPTEKLTGTLTLRSASAPGLGFATDQEVEDAVDDVYGEGAADTIPEDYEVATDEEVQAEVVEGVFGQ